MATSFKAHRPFQVQSRAVSVLSEGPPRQLQPQAARLSRPQHEVWPVREEGGQGGQQQVVTERRGKNGGGEGGGQLESVQFWDASNMAG